MKVIQIFIISLFLNFPTCFSQNWPKIYGGNTNTFLQGGLNETYDKGYLMVGQVDPGPSVPQMYGWVIKTDINGNQLWTKTIASSSYQIGFLGSDKTPDGDFILSGSTTKLDPSNYDVLFMKFDACGENEWCNIISTPGNGDFGLKIKSIPDGYIALVKYFQDWQNKRIWLFKMDFTGNLIWEKLISETDSMLLGQEGRDLLVLPDGGYLVTGDGYDSTSVNLYTLRPLIIRTDSAGNDLWTLPFGHSIGFIGNVALYPNENQNGCIYIASRHNLDSIPPDGRVPCFLKVNASGQELYYRDLIPYANVGGSTTLNLKNNDTLFISTGWIIGNADTIGILKCDTLGKVTKKKVLFQQDCGGLSESLFTSDVKYLAGGHFNPSGGNYKIYLYKFNTNLGIDSVYTQPRIYDSLCPHPIVSDTISLDNCAVITDIRDPIVHPEKCRLLIYPNPAREQVTIQFPQYLKRQSTNGSTAATTIYHQWNSTTLEIYDLFGRFIFSKDVPKRTEKIELDISLWHPGMYVARLVFMNEVVASAKFVIR